MQNQLKLMLPDMEKIVKSATILTNIEMLIALTIFNIISNIS